MWWACLAPDNRLRLTSLHIVAVCLQQNPWASHLQRRKQRMSQIGDPPPKRRRRDVLSPRGPKDQNNSRFRSRLKISSENEIFRASHPPRLYFCGEIETSRLKFSSGIKNIDRDWKFRSRSNFFDRWALWGSETGRIRFRRVRFQTPSSVSFLPSPSSGERTQWVPLSLLFVCQSELTEFAPKLSEAQWVLFSETVLLKQYSARFLLVAPRAQLREAQRGNRNRGNRPEKFWATLAESLSECHLHLRDQEFVLSSPLK